MDRHLIDTVGTHESGEAGDVLRRRQRDMYLRSLRIEVQCERIDRDVLEGLDLDPSIKCVQARRALKAFLRMGPAALIRDDLRLAAMFSAAMMSGWYLCAAGIEAGVVADMIPDLSDLLARGS